MWGIIWQAIRFASTASLGYFINDVGDGLSKVVPSSQDPSTGKTRWWVVVLLIVAGSLLIALFLKLIVPSKYSKK